MRAPMMTRWLRTSCHMLRGEKVQRPLHEATMKRVAASCTRNTNSSLDLTAPRLCLDPGPHMHSCVTACDRLPAAARLHGGRQ